MKQKALIFLSIFFLLCFWENGAYGTDNRKALRFNISLEKSAYFVDEAIYLEMLATNISNREVGISDMTYNASSGHFRIILKDEHDQLVDYHGGEAHIVGYPDSWSGLIMSPGESWLQVVDLLSIFGKWGDAAHQIRLFLPPGGYKVQVIYDTSPKVLIAKNSEPEDRQTLYSNVLQFEVLEPTGSEKAAHDELIDAFTAFENERKNPRGRISMLRKFLDKYPDSFYQPIIYSYLLLCYPYPGYIIERRKLIDEALTTFPNSGLAYKLLDERYEEMKNLAQAPTITKSRIMQKMKIASSTSRASFYAQCLVDMQRIGLRTAERMKQQQEKR